MEMEACVFQGMAGQMNVAEGSPGSARCQGLAGTFTRPDSVIPCRVARQQSPTPFHRVTLILEIGGLTVKSVGRRFALPWEAVVRDRQLYEQILGIGKPWRVERVELNLEGCEIHGCLAREASARWLCRECDERCSIRNHQPERTWQHLDAFQYRTVLHAELPPSHCPPGSPQPFRLVVLLGPPHNARRTCRPPEFNPSGFDCHPNACFLCALGFGSNPRRTKYKKKARSAGPSDSRGRSTIRMGLEPAVITEHPAAHPVEPRARRGNCPLGPWVSDAITIS